MIIRLECSTCEAPWCVYCLDLAFQTRPGSTPQRRANLHFRLDYHMLHWRPSHIGNGVQLAECDSYDIQGLSAMILRNVPNHRIRFIPGANGEGRQRVRRVPSKRVSCIDYFFINCDETVRAWLLSNPGLDDQLNLMIHFYRDEGDTRPATPALRAHQDHHENVVAD